MTIFVYIGLTRNLILEIPPSEICLISGDWDDLGIPNFAQMSLMKSYWILRNARVKAVTISELLMENQQVVKITHPPRIGLQHNFAKGTSKIICYLDLKNFDQKAFNSYQESKMSEHPNSFKVFANLLRHCTIICSMYNYLLHGKSISFDIIIKSSWPKVAEKI